MNLNWALRGMQIPSGRQQTSEETGEVQDYEGGGSGRMRWLSICCLSASLGPLSGSTIMYLGPFK